MLKKLLDLLSDAAVYGISSMLTRLVGLLLLPILTQYLTRQEYGVLMMLGIVSSLFLPLGNLGMTNAIFRRFNLEKDPRARGGVLSTGLLSVAISSLALLGVALASAPYVSRIIGGECTPDMVRLSLLGAAATTVGMIPFVTLRAARRVKTAAAVNVAKVVVSMLVTIWLVAAQGQGIRGVLIGTLVGEVALGVVLLGLTLRSLRAAAELATWKRMASYGLPFVPHQLQAVGLNLFGMYVVGQMLGLGAAGLYGIATRFASPITFIVGAIQQSWVPYKFQIHAEEANPRLFFQSTFTYYVAGLSYLWVGVALWGPDTVRLITRAEFHGAAYLMWAVALIPVAQGLYFMSSTGFELSDNTRPMPLVSVVGLLIVVATSFTLIPLTGAMGAAWATSLGWLAMAVVMYWLAQRRYAISYDWPTIGWFAATASLFVAGGNMAQSMSLLPRLSVIILLSLTYPFSALFLLLRSRDERDRMLHLLAKFRPLASSR
jgi:O-antigen/teichoic acid export membrane protein